jgi:ecdysone 20-monooxygenase
MMPFMSMLLFYFIIVLFLFYTFKNNKPLKWNEILSAITFNQHSRQNEEILRIPGPIRLPILGTKWNCLFTKMNKLHEYYADLNRKYGNIVMELTGNVPVISLFNRQDIEKVLKSQSKYPFRPPTEIVSFYRLSRPDRYSSVGLVNAQGPEWAHLRMKLTPKTLESRKVLAAFCPDLNQVCDDFINVMKKKRNSENIVENVDDILKSMSIESACCLILGRRIGFLNETSEETAKFHELETAAKNVFKGCRDAYYGEKIIL